VRKLREWHSYKFSIDEFSAKVSARELHQLLGGHQRC